jgi:hypothetical protein
MSAAALTHECRDYVKQMALPLVPQRRVKGALQTVSRESGVSYSKLRKIYYGLTDHILAFEFRSIAEAYKRHVVTHEQRLAQELETLRSLIAEQEMRERQHGLELDMSARPRAVEAMGG